MITKLPDGSMEIEIECSDEQAELFEKAAAIQGITVEELMIRAAKWYLSQEEEQ
jgi:uncharacterized protein (DUF1778 family)